VLGSNQRRLSRRFYRPLLQTIGIAGDLAFLHTAPRMIYVASAPRPCSPSRAGHSLAHNRSCPSAFHCVQLCPPVLRCRRSADDWQILATTVVRLSRWVCAVPGCEHARDRTLRADARWCRTLSVRPLWRSLRGQLRLRSSSSASRVSSSSMRMRWRSISAARSGSHGVGAGSPLSVPRGGSRGVADIAAA
jgi:hypothetical protein